MCCAAVTVPQSLQRDSLSLGNVGAIGTQLELREVQEFSISWYREGTVSYARAESPFNMPTNREWGLRVQYGTACPQWYWYGAISRRRHGCRVDSIKIIAQILASLRYLCFNG